MAGGRGAASQWTFGVSTVPQGGGTGPCESLPSSGKCPCTPGNATLNSKKYTTGQKVRVKGRETRSKNYPEKNESCVF